MICSASVFERKLALHTAPSLLGIKAASLINLKKSELDIGEHARYFNRKAGMKGLKIEILCECNERILILLYNEKLLSEQLREKERLELLESFGYSPEWGLPDMLKRLSERVKESCGFPHEIGLFLSYPVEDVKGFIENDGENFKFCGCWKVYGNEEKARRTFENYNKCRKYLCNKLNMGETIYEALKIS